MQSVTETLPAKRDLGVAHNFNCPPPGKARVRLADALVLRYNFDSDTSATRAFYYFHNVVRSIRAINAVLYVITKV